MFLFIYDTFCTNYRLDDKVMNLYLTVSATVEHVANNFTIFLERGGQMFCLYSFYLSLNGTIYCPQLVE